jgi:predicted DNA-binding transcriptional regulator YafY
MDSAERLLKLLALLEGRIDWTAEELARRLEVTPRTVRRDVNRLRNLGYPVAAVAGPGGGYSLGAGGKMPPLLLDDDEALAVALGLRVATTSAVGGLEDSSLSAMAKLEHVLPPRLRKKLEDVSESTISTLAVPATRADHTTLATAAGAIRARQRLRFAYTDGENRESHRHIEPARLVHTGRRWYLVGFDLDRDDWRTFRLDRASEPKATGIGVKSRKAPDPVELVQRGIAIDVWTHRASVKLDATVDEARRIIPVTIGMVEASGDGSHLLIGADDLAWLARYLLNLPFSLEVESPQELREELATIGRELQATYS